jgi:hypothetical protein
MFVSGKFGVHQTCMVLFATNMASRVMRNKLISCTQKKCREAAHLWIILTHDQVHRQEYA